MIIDLWKRLPSPLRRIAHLTVQFCERSLVPLWVAVSWRAGQAAAPTDAVVVVGLFGSSTGIGRGGRLFLEAMSTSGFASFALDATALAKVHADLPVKPGAARPKGPALVISHLNPPELEKVLQHTRARFLKGARHVGYWAWEQSIAPRSWRSAFKYVDAVAAPSTFAAEAIRRIAPPSLPVVVVPHLVSVRDATPDRNRFSIPADCCATLCVFDLKSTAARKNPWGALEAYRRAVPAGSPRSVFVCKISGSRSEPDLFRKLREDVSWWPDVVIIDETLSEVEMSALLASVDIIISLHRSEGFGLVLAEAMLLGKAIVATGWSGNMDFMTDQSAALVRHHLAPALDPQGMYDAGSLWAEPDLDHAALLLSELIADGRRRTRLGDVARREAEAFFNASVWADRVRAAFYDCQRASKP